MIAGRLQPRSAERERDLRPVPRLVDQAVEQQLARGEDEIAAAEDGERARLVGDVFVERRGELLQLAADRGAVVEQRRRVQAAQPGLRVERRAAEALQVPALDEKDVIDQRSDGGIASTRLHL